MAFLRNFAQAVGLPLSDAWLQQNPFDRAIVQEIDRIGKSPAPLSLWTETELTLDWGRYCILKHDGPLSAEDVERIKEGLDMLVSKDQEGPKPPSAVEVLQEGVRNRRKKELKTVCDNSKSSRTAFSDSSCPPASTSSLWHSRLSVRWIGGSEFSISKMACSTAVRDSGSFQSSPSRRCSTSVNCRMKSLWLPARCINPFTASVEVTTPEIKGNAASSHTFEWAVPAYGKNEDSGKAEQNGNEQDNTMAVLIVALPVAVIPNGTPYPKQGTYTRCSPPSLSACVRFRSSP